MALLVGRKLTAPNDTRTLDAARLGAMGVDLGTSGSLYFDDFESRRFSFIGALLDPGEDQPDPGHPGEGWLARDYSYDEDHPHGVAAVAYSGGPDTYNYDLNGNTLAPHSRRTPGRCAFGAHLPWVQVPGVQV